MMMTTTMMPTTGGVRARSPYGGNRRPGFRLRNRLVMVGLFWVVVFAVLAHNCYYSYDYPTTQCPKVTTDILVVLRTGATEALEKLPVHFETTLRCVSDYVVYSDVEEQIAGHTVRNVFAADDAISDALRASHELGFYRHLQRLGRQGLLALQAQTASSPPMVTNVSDDPSWKLDRFKFLPMVAQALKHRPTAKWFVFMEADTYLVWENLVSYLSLFDPTKPLYIGRHMYMNDVLFAHGGSGFVLSRPAMERVVGQRNAHGEHYDTYTKQSTAGDMVLGRILTDVNVPLFSAFPHFQGDPVTSLYVNVTKLDRRPWCYAPITYHHMREAEIRALWEFEQSRRRQQGKSNAPLRHADVFKLFIRPQLRPRVDGWDNLSLNNRTSSSDDAAAAVPSFARCNAICEADTACLQFSYDTAAQSCATSTQAILGEAATRQCVEYSSAAGRCVKRQGDGDGGEEKQQTGTTTPGSVQSGWMMHRMQRYVEEMDTMCGGEKTDMWVV